MRVIGLDPAAATGFCWSDGTTRHYGVWQLTPRAGAHPGGRLEILSDLLTRAINDWGCDLIAAEDASFGSPNPSVQALHNELRAIVKLVGARENIRVEFFGPTTVKKFATDEGHASKQQMVRAVKSHYGLVVNDDEADAIFVCELARRPDCWAEKKPSKPRKSKAKAGRLF